MPKLNLDRDAIDVGIGVRLRKARRAAGLSLEALGNEIGLTYQQIQKYETGANRLSCAMLIRISRALRCDPHYILGETPDHDEHTDVVSVSAKIRALPVGDTRSTVITAIHGMVDAVRSSCV